jgi:hypothetical protein
MTFPGVGPDIDGGGYQACKPASPLGQQPTRVFNTRIHETQPEPNQPSQQSLGVTTLIITDSHKSLVHESQKQVVLTARMLFCSFLLSSEWMHRFIIHPQTRSGR